MIPPAKNQALAIDDPAADDKCQADKTERVTMANPHLEQGEGQLLLENQVGHESAQTPRTPCCSFVQYLERIPERQLEGKPFTTTTQNRTPRGEAMGIRSKGT